MIPVDEALAKVLALARGPRHEVVGLADAFGRVLTKPATARLTQPPFDASAMDGYAMRLADIQSKLPVVGTSAAGHPWQGKPAPGTAIRIFTGAPVPEGFDHVELQENAERAGDDIRVIQASRGRNIRKRGNDFAEGDQLQPGRRLSAADIGLLAAMNVAQVTVAARPRVAILAGGDELVRPGEDPGPGQIVSSNDLAIAAQVRDAGGEPTILPIARDTEESLRQAFDAARGADLLVTIGGASVGDHDLIAKVAEKVGVDRAFYKVAMRPGKPLMAGMMADTAMLGLPGNPVSAMVCGMIFMQALIRRMSGMTDTDRSEMLPLAVDLLPEGPRQHYLRAAITRRNGQVLVRPFEDQDSARLSIMSQADALLVRPANDPARAAGEPVTVIRIGR
ncbi:molybdopterin molybdotransferase MoeA [Paracoccus sp. 1_MG-2023]|uniref:molybdopterin molybdotransferase MoeA n=1 Tax=unclassified Paracoccus (in: a-proteobacteria) TaxID=2688777 RepID=UPI001C0905FE|nr:MULTISPECIES: gephyrin-like molybdotransferase Glp [unclassified Paracoccus (in: a-proteobacteria)]MBU2958698.1 molybdopterin molybdotransferase MoeA [Paracoccus sp. C2R09]MDO6667691.1 molybdopterin molybdotransferase MoeA [Paracoccus sp. 1_MG-2023]